MRPIAMAAALMMGLAVSQGSVQAQTRGAVELAGEWTGYGIDGSGNRIDLVLRFARGDEGYAGVLQGAGGTTPEMPLRNITVVESTVTFDFDFVGGKAPELIRVRLEYGRGTLTGSYTDSVGDSDRMYFERGSEPGTGESRGNAQAQTRGAVELAGEWTGYAIDGGGNRIDLVLRFAREDEGFAGVLQGAGGTTPEMPLRNITVLEGTVTFDFDFVGGRAPELIRVRLEYGRGTLTGSYTDSVGDSDRMYFERGSVPETGK